MGDQAAGGFLSPWLQRRRFSAALPHIQGRILDYGCGSGTLAQYFQPEDYFGFDLNQEALEIARARYPRHTFRHEIPEANGFDTIVMLALIEHIAEPAQLLKSLAKNLKPDGRFVLTTPHPWFHEFHTWGASLGIFSLEANQEHKELFDRRSMVKVAQMAGLQVNIYRRFLFGANQLFLLVPQNRL